MDARTREALEASIRHWEENVAKPEFATLGPKDCALCVMFNPYLNRGKGDISCTGCPVQEITGQDFCHGSPFWEVDAADEEGDEEAFLDAATRELAFLRSLIPSDTEEPV